MCYVGICLEALYGTVGRAGGLRHWRPNFSAVGHDSRHAVTDWELHRAVCKLQR